MKLTEQEDVIIGTSLQGYLYTTYADIVAKFGTPNCAGDGYKVDAEWAFTSPEGPITIYNYKDGKNYCGEDGDEVEDITEWHIGGLKVNVCYEVARVFGDDKVHKGW